MAGDECDRQSHQVWRIEGEGGTAYPEDQRFNRDVGLELPGCWVSTLKTLCVKPRPPPSV